MKTNSFQNPAVVSPDQWLAVRRELLREEKEFTKLRDRLSARRRELPWVKIEEPYVFQGTGGRLTLADLFEGRSQLIVYHFMLGPGWEEGCRGCSYVSDHLEPAIVHLKAKDVSFTAVSRAPLAEITPFKQRMGWTFNWVSSAGTSFNRDFGVSFTSEEAEKGKAFYNFEVRDIPMDELPGLSVFARSESGDVFRTYSTYSRGLDLLLGTYSLLDLVPKGRDEDPESPMSWVRHHDRYTQAADVAVAQ